MSTLRDLVIRVGYQIEAGPLAEANKQVDAFKANAVKSEKGVQSLGAQVTATGTQVAQSTSSMTTGFDGLYDKFKQNEQGLEGINKALKDNRGLFVGAFAATAGTIGFAVRKAAAFEEQMSRVGALARATDDELGILSQTARDLGAKTAFSASQAAEGMSYLAMAGFKVNEIVAAMPGLLDTAAAAQADLGTTADIVSNILSGFSMKAGESSRIADVLTATFTSSNTTLEMLGDTMSYVAPIASSVGAGIEDVAAMAGRLGDVGIQGQRAGTALRAVFTRLAAPTGEAATLLNNLGVQTADSSGNMLSMIDILRQIEDRTKSVGSAQRSAILTTLVGTEAVSAFSALLDVGADSIASYADELRNSQGLAQVVAEKQLNNLAGSLEELGGAFEEAQISIGNAFIPVIRLGADILRGVINVFNALPGPIKTVVAVGLGLGAVLSGLLLAASFIVPQMIALGQAMPIVRTQFAKMIPTLQGYATSMWAAVAPMLPTIGIVLGIVAALGLLVLIGQDIYAFFTGAGDTITGRIVAWAKNCSWLQAIFRGIGTAVGWVKDGIVRLIGAASSLKTVLLLPFLPIIAVVKGVIWVFSQAKTAIQNIGSPIQWVRDRIAGLGGAVGVLKRVFATAFAPILLPLRGIVWLFNTIKGAITGVGKPVQAVSSGVSGLVSAAKPIVSVLLTPLKLVQGLAGGIGKVFGWVKSGLSAVGSAGASAIQTAKTAAASLASRLGAGIKAGASKIKSGFGAVVGWIKDRVGSVAASGVTAITTAEDTALSVKDRLSLGVRAGISAMTTSIATARERLGAFAETVRSLPGRALDTAKQWKKGLFDKLGAGIAAIRERFSGLTKSAVGAGEGMAETAPRISGVQAVAMKLGSASQTLRTTFSSVVDRIKGRFGQLVSDFKANPIGINMDWATTESFVSNITGIVDATRSWMAKRGIDLPEITVPEIPDLVESLGTWYDGVKDWFATKFDLGTILNNAFDKAYSLISAPMRWVGEKIGLLPRTTADEGALQGIEGVNLELSDSLITDLTSSITALDRTMQAALADTMRYLQAPMQPLWGGPGSLSIALQSRDEDADDPGWLGRGSSQPPTPPAMRVSFTINVDARGATEQTAQLIATKTRDEIRRVLEELLREDYSSMVLEGE